MRRVWPSARIIEARATASGLACHMECSLLLYGAKLAQKAPGAIQAIIWPQLSSLKSV